jgi:hypothetical protein
MTRLIYIAFRNDDPIGPDRLRVLAERSVPTDLPHGSPRIVEGDDHSYILVNPSEHVLQKDGSVCIGPILDQKGWERVGSPAPDGSFLIVRNDKEHLEVLTDRTASRTAWFCLTERFLAISSSQRPLVSLLRSFKPDPQAVSWFLSSGHLGPGNSWDSRIRMVGPNSRLVLLKKGWELKPIERSPIPKIELPKDPGPDLVSRIEKILTGLDLDMKRTVVQLSGGYDSRGLFLLLRKRFSPATYTLGTEASLRRKGSDAYVVGELTKSIGNDHRFYTAQRTKEPFEKMFRRFLEVGEARIDHLNWYIDGYEHLRDLIRAGRTTSIRGDEALGWHPATPIYGDELDIRKYQGLTLFSDISNIDMSDYGLEATKLPQGMKKREGETFSAWRDRIYFEIRLPCILSSHNEHISPYLEPVNPLTIGTIMDLAVSLPDKLRDDKRLWKDIVRSLVPKVPFATEPSLEDVNDLVNGTEIMNAMGPVLGNYSGTILPKVLIQKLSEDLKKPKGFRKNRTQRSWLDRLVPDLIRRFINRRRRTTTLDLRRLAFRAFTIISMERVFIDDSGAL